MSRQMIHRPSVAPRYRDYCSTPTESECDASTVHYRAIRHRPPCSRRLEALLYPWSPHSVISSIRFNVRDCHITCSRRYFHFAAEIIWRLLPPILRLGRACRLPLHVARIVSPAALERHDVVDHVARATARGFPRRRTWMVVLEVPLGRLAPLDPTVAIAGDAGRPG